MSSIDPPLDPETGLPQEPAIDDPTEGGRDTPIDPVSEEAGRPDDQSQDPDLVVHDADDDE